MDDNQTFQCKYRSYCFLTLSGRKPDNINVYTELTNCIETYYTDIFFFGKPQSLLEFFLWSSMHLVARTVAAVAAALQPLLKVSMNQENKFMKVHGVS